MSVSIIGIFHLDEDGERARQRFAPYLEHYIKFRLSQLLSPDGLIALPPLDGPPPPSEAEMAGSPEEVTERILQAVDDVGGADRIQCGMDLGGLPVEHVFRTMDLFAEHVIPKLAPVGGSAPAMASSAS
jgi:hypothetical protein